MGIPTSSIFSDIYLQYLENTKIFDILVKHHIFQVFPVCGRQPVSLHKQCNEYPQHIRYTQN